MNIAVLAGGLSTERDVSLSTGSMVCRALRELGHRALLLDVYLGLPGLPADPLSLFTGNESPSEILTVPDAEPDLAAVRALRPGDPSFFGPNVLTLCGLCDLAFIALHGACGEDGRLQAALELAGVPFTGSGSLGSALAMNKELTKRLLRQAGLPTADWVAVTSETQAAGVAETLGLPCVVKPLSGGSSVGVFIPKTPAELREGLAAALAYDGRVITEAYIPGREFSVGILEGRALPVIEITPLKGFYDFKNKYQPGLTREVCPAPLSEEETARVQRLALSVHEALLLGSYSRVDFILGPDGFICLEANTLPGMTPTSLLPQEAQAAGIGYNELCRRLVLSAPGR